MQALASYIIRVKFRRYNLLYRPHSIVITYAMCSLSSGMTPEYKRQFLFHQGNSLASKTEDCSETILVQSFVQERHISKRP